MPHWLITNDLALEERATEHFAEGLQATVLEETLETMKRVAPIDDSELVDGLHEVVEDGLHAQIVGEADHTEMVLKGTGIYGPRGRPIEAAPGNPFVWVDEDTGDLIFAYEIKGMRGQDFAEDAIDRIEPRIDGMAVVQATKTRQRFSGGD